MSRFHLGLHAHCFTLAFVLTAALGRAEVVYQPSCAAPYPLQTDPLLPQIDPADKDGNGILDKYEGEFLPREELNPTNLQDHVKPPGLK